jgi:hypothetical protein
MDQASPLLLNNISNDSDEFWLLAVHVNDNFTLFVVNTKVVSFYSRMSRKARWVYFTWVSLKFFFASKKSSGKIFSLHFASKFVFALKRKETKVILVFFHFTSLLIYRFHVVSPCQCCCCMSMSMPQVHVNATRPSACPCLKSPVCACPCLYAACPCCPCFSSLLHVHVSMLYVHAAWTCCRSTLNEHVTWSCCTNVNMNMNINMQDECKNQNEHGHLLGRRHGNSMDKMTEMFRFLSFTAFSFRCWNFLLCFVAKQAKSPPLFRF